MTTLDPQSPYANLPDHRGEPRKIPVHFFADPPPEIGALHSAESNYRPERTSADFTKRIILTAICGSAVFGGLYALFRAQDRPIDGGLLISLIAAALVVALVLFATRFRKVCSYVGQTGAARFTITSRNNPKPTAEILQFDQIASLFTSRTRHYVNGAYTGTNYQFTWHDLQGRRIMTFRGKYSEPKNKRVKTGDPYLFVAASEIAWSVFYLDRAAQQLADEGSIPFHIGGNRTVRVGPKFIEFHFDKTPVRLTTDDIEKVSLANGQFSFKHKDAKWYSRAGKYSFSYASMANARVFLMSLDKLMGYRWR